MFKDKVLLITGGTGSFGSTLLRKFANSDLKEIRVFSRDEKKQEDLRIELKNDKINFIIGDVRDFHSINTAMEGVDYVFNAAALKQVPSCEFYPMQAIQTNILGSENVLEAAVHNRVKRVVVLSTDKAVYPINTMGMTKSLMEKLCINKARMPQAQLAQDTNRQVQGKSQAFSAVPVMVTSCVREVRSFPCSSVRLKAGNH